MPAFSQEDARLATSIKDFLLQNLKKNYKQADLIEKFNTSEHFLQKTFKRYHGTTPAKMVLDARMQLAVTYLKGNNRDLTTIKYIASITGYSTPAAFLKAFKRYYGAYPHDYHPGE